jgi:hypothetical protein
MENVLQSCPRRRSRRIWYSVKASLCENTKGLPAVFPKSETPEARKEKAESLNEIKQEYVKNFGKDITETQSLKKNQ